MTDTVGYTPGEAWLISGASAMVMTDGDAADARRYWDLVRRNASGAELVDGISPGPAAGALAVLVWEPGGVRVLVRGTAVVRVRPAAGARFDVTAANLLTWREELLPDVAEVEVVPAEHEPADEAPEDTDLLPVPAGVVRAAFARRRAEDQPLPAEAAPPIGGGELAAKVEPARSVARATSAESAASAGREPAGSDTPERASSNEIRGTADVTDDLEPVDESVIGDDAVTVISMVPAPARDGRAAGTTPARVAGGVDDLESSLDAISAAPEATPATLDAKPGLPDADRAEEAARHRAPDVTQSVPLDYEEEPILERGPSADPGRTGFSNGSGQAAPASDLLPGPPDPGRPEPVLGDHDGITELAEDLPAGFIPPPLPPPLAPGWVYASLCPSGHANQPHAGNCRICGQPIPPGDPVAAPQPLLGRLRFSTGELVDLDRRVIVGRAPSVSRVSSSELPRLVTVPSPQQDISRSHAEVRIEDWHVVVADLHSTNGTVLRAPDRPEQLLHPGQEMVIEPGWTVDLGDGVTVAVEAAG